MEHVANLPQRVIASGFSVQQGLVILLHLLVNQQPDLLDLAHTQVLGGAEHSM